MSLFYSDKPYNHLPALPPEKDLETPAILKACIGSHRELAKLNMAANLIPNQNVLINSIPLLESQASSAIENIVTTTDELFQYAESHTGTVAPNIKETLRYRSALNMGFESLEKRPLSISTVCDICSCIKGLHVDIRRTPGTTLVNDATGEKIYTPPNGENLLRDLLTNWQNYLHRNDGIDPLIKLAVQHYQFEAIHPFTDGNGRTGRILNILFLVDKKLLSTPILYLSRFINKNKSDYYKKLLRVTTHGEWEDWALYIIEAVRETSLWTTKKILAIQNLIRESCIDVQNRAPQIYKKELVELLFNQPYVRIVNLIENNLGERQTASKYLQTLCNIGFLEELKAGKEKLFINTRFLNLLKEG